MGRPGRPPKDTTRALALAVFALSTEERRRFDDFLGLLTDSREGSAAAPKPKRDRTRRKMETKAAEGAGQ